MMRSAIHIDVFADRVYAINYQIDASRDQVRLIADQVGVIGDQVHEIIWGDDASRNRVDAWSCEVSA